MPDVFSFRQAFKRPSQKYIQGAAPWEYDTSDLITLCEKCHAKYHRDVAKTKIMIDTLLIISERLKAAI